MKCAYCDRGFPISWGSPGENAHAHRRDFIMRVYNRDGSTLGPPYISRREYLVKDIPERDDQWVIMNETTAQVRL